MANNIIGKKIELVLSVPNIDAKYGPYNSTSQAISTLGENGMDCICNGLTVGIVESGIVVEYWFQNGTLVPKQSGNANLVWS